MRRVLYVAVGLVAVLSLLVVLFKPFPGNQVSSTVAGRSVLGISAHRGSAARLNSDSTSATLQLGGHTIRITADAVELPGGRSVAIPAGCKAVELREDENRVRVFLDGIETP